MYKDEKKASFSITTSQKRVKYVGRMLTAVEKHSKWINMEEDDEVHQGPVTPALRRF